MSDDAVPEDRDDSRDPLEPSVQAETLGAPTPRDEIAALLSSHEGRLGDVYRLTEEGLTPEQIAERLNVATPNFVYTYRYQASAALDGKTTNGTTMRRQALGALRSLLKAGRGRLSPAAVRLLQSNTAAVEASAEASDPSDEAQADVDEVASAATALHQLNGVPGIYAFSYGWYLESFVDPERGQTLIKVGQARDVAARIRQHTAGARTHMPEPLALIRVYAIGSRDLLATEKSFHELLETAGHSNPRRVGSAARQVGREWFLTNEDFLDSIAKALELRTLYIGQSDFITD